MDKLLSREVLALIPFILAVLVSAAGNLLLKFGVSKIGHLSLAREHLVSELFKIFTNPFIVVGLIGYVFGFLMWLKVLSTTEVSRAYPALVSSTIIMVLLASSILLREQLTLIKLIGVVVIIGGIFLIFK